MLKNIIFDLGNVILKFSRDFLLSNFYTGEDYALLKDKLFCDWEMLDDDSISLTDYKKKVISSLPNHLKRYANSVLDNWEYYMTYSEGIISLIQELKQNGYKLYLLSNMTYHFINNDYKFPILKEFDGLVYSAPIKMLKPNPEIYQYLLDKYSLNPKECLFVDDMKTNLVGATRFGINTFLFEGDVKKLRDFILTF